MVCSPRKIDQLVVWNLVWIGYDSRLVEFFLFFFWNTPPIVVAGHGCIHPRFVVTDGSGALRIFPALNGLPSIEISRFSSLSSLVVRWIFWRATPSAQAGLAVL